MKKSLIYRGVSVLLFGLLGSAAGYASVKKNPPVASVPEIEAAAAPAAVILLAGIALVIRGRRKA